MRRAVKFLLPGLAGLAVLLGVAAVALSVAAERKRTRVVTVDVKPVIVPTDADALAQGKYLFESRGCAECHGPEGRGSVVIDASNGLYVRAPAIAPGAAVVAGYRVEDWVRTVRHGVKPDGRPAIVMPSQDYARLTDADTGALVAYVQTLPQAEGGAGEIRFPFLVNALYAVGAVPDAASLIDHALPPAAPVPVGPTADHGRYVANMCLGCHGPGFSGGSIRGGPPDWPPASNLTPGEGGVLGRYTDATALRTMLRTGARPDGSAVSTVMPFQSLKALNDTDVAALFAYLKTLPARPAGNR